MNKPAKNYLQDLNLNPVNNTKCSDWHLTWGLGTNKFGKLFLLNNGDFFWYGQSQGRHGQKYGSGFFHFDKDLKIINRTFKSIDLGEVKKASELLNKIKL
jgi:hypothetical protein